MILQLVELPTTSEQRQLRDKFMGVNEDHKIND